MECKILVDQMSESTIELLESNLIYADESILSFKITATFVELKLKDGVNKEKIEERVLDLIKKLRPVKPIPSKLKYESEMRKASYSGDVYAELLERGEVYPLQDGVVALTGLPLHMFEVLDKKIVEFAKTQKAKKILLPITVKFQDLLDSHYFDRTPQHANFLSTIEESARSISNFSKTFKENSTIEKELLKTPHSMCRSAVCLNCYPTLRNKVFKNDETLVYTAEGRVFRHEYKKVNSLERLYEFSCREIIYLGSKEFVREKLVECESWFIEFIKNFDLVGELKSATDPFFVENARALQFYQAVEDSKYEIKILNPFTGIDVSVGSMNFHALHFSKSYNIEFENGEGVNSGCVGFGLERMIFTVLSQYGTEVSKWPEKLISFFEVEEYK